MTTLSQVSESLRGEFLRDGALNAIWLAHSCHMAVSALREAAIAPVPPEITSEQAQHRATLFALAQGFVARQRDEQLVRAYSHLKIWMKFIAGELSEEAELPT